MNWYLRYKTAAPLPAVENSYPDDFEYQYGLLNTEVSLTDDEAKSISDKGPISYLGSGGWGVAWDAENSVKKLTSDPHEYETAHDLIKRQKEHGNNVLPYAVYVFSAREFKRDLYELIIEKVQVLDRQQKEVFSLVWSVSDRAYNSFDSKLGRFMELMKSKEFVFGITDKEAAVRFAQSLREFNGYFRNRTIIDHDISSTNVGLRGNQVVVLDLGAIDFA
jgi:hypothetical protein